MKVIHMTAETHEDRVEAFRAIIGMALHCAACVDRARVLFEIYVQALLPKTLSEKDIQRLHDEFKPENPTAEEQRILDGFIARILEAQA